ncbi:MAG: hypothetical protein QM762_29960 [Chryseolinea sp.]
MSTFLLLFIMVSIVVCLTSFVVAIRTQYATGDYVFVNGDNLKNEDVNLPPSKVIVINDIENCLFISSDSLKLQVLKDDRSRLHVVSSGDSVRISAKERTNGRLLLYVPTNSQVVAIRTNMTMTGAFDFLELPSYSITLDNSKLVTLTRENHAFIQQLRIIGKGEAVVQVSKRFHIHSLDVTNTTFISIAEGWQIGALKTTFNEGFSSEMVKVGDSVSIVGHFVTPN